MASYGDNFNRADNTSNLGSANWTARAGVMGINGNGAYGVTVTGAYWNNASWVDPLETDDAAVALTIGSSGTGTGGVGALVSCGTAGGGTGVMGYFYSTTASIYAATANLWGTNTTWYLEASGTIPAVTAGDVLEIRNVGNVYTLWRNGVATAVTWTDSGNVITRDANHRLAGVAGIQSPAGYYTRIDAWAAVDNGPVTLTPGAATLSLTGAPPTVTAPYTVTPGPATLTFTGSPPMLGQPVTVQPGPATLTLSGAAPTVTSEAPAPQLLPELSSAVGSGPDLPTGDALGAEWVWDWPDPTRRTWPSTGVIRTVRPGLTTIYWVGGLWETWPGQTAPTFTPAQNLIQTFSDVTVNKNTGARTYGANRLDWESFEVINIPHSGAIYPAGMSVAEAQSELVAAIQAIPGKFILMGGSLGGAIVSNVYDMLRGIEESGSGEESGAVDLTGRNDDMIMGWAMGNPRRQGGRTFPGGPLYCSTGTGVYDPLTDTEERWWEWAVPAGTYPAYDQSNGVTYQIGDPVACLGTSDVENSAREIVAESMETTVFDEYRFNQLVVEGQSDPAWQLITSVLDVVKCAHGNSWLQVQPFLDDDDHRTYWQYTIDEINALAEVPPAPTRRLIELERYAVNHHDVITAGAEVCWANVNTSGDAIIVGVNFYDNTDTIIATDTALLDDDDSVLISATKPGTTVTAPSSSSGSSWKVLSADYWIPVNATSAALVFDVEPEALTTGVVWFGIPLFKRNTTARNIINFDAPLATQCADTWHFTRELIDVEWSLRKEQPLVRYWDAEWNLQFVGGIEYKALFSWISNDTGPGQVEIPFDSPLAQWIQDETGRIERGEGRNVCITVDYCGARWSGLMDKFAVEQRDDGDVVLVVDWMHDYEHVKWYHVWCDPLYPSIAQPRVFLCAGPVDWAMRLALFLNVFREHFPIVTWPDDPLDGEEWLNSMNLATWPLVVTPKGFLTSMASGVVWSIPISRFANWHDMAHPILEDAEISVSCKRYLDGDLPPWPGAVLRHGTLVVDFVDKSGVYVGTSHGGTIFDGLARTIVEFLEDFIESTEVLILDTNVPPEYYETGSKLTRKELPYVVFQEGETSPIQTSSWINSPAKGIQVLCGGHSMMGINEIISATVQFGFDLAGTLIFMGGLGSIIDTLIKPLYEDMFLAWWAVKNFSRAQNGGWERLFEYFQEGASRAFTISSLMVLRAGFWATKSTVSWRVSVVDGLPFMIGDNGLGHFFLDDRVGLVLKGDHAIHMDRCRKLDLAWDENNPAEWMINIGDDRVFQDPAQRAWGKIERLVAGLRDAGVW